MVYPDIDSIIKNTFIGLMVNNPSTTLFREVCQHIESRRYANEEDRETRDAIAFVLSIGTGREPQRYKFASDLF